jgi:glycosyltransferase involved in cell wall biosynthesis
LPRIKRHADSGHYFTDDEPGAEIMPVQACAHLTMNFSIIIPTYSRCAPLRRTLDSVAMIDFSPGDAEILVVDNSPGADARSVFEQTQSRYPAGEWRYFHEPVPGLLSGRHRGALEARGDLFLFLDDDVRVSRSALRALEDSFRDEKIVLAGGPSHPQFDTEPPEWLGAFFSETEEGRHCSWLSLLDGGNQSKEISPLYVWGLNYAIRKAALFDCGGFHPDCMPKRLQRFQGDGESGLNCKIAAAGLKTLYVPGAAVLHEVAVSRMTPEYFESRAFYEGVCDSYSQVRKSGHAPAPASPLQQAGRSVKRFIRSMGSAKAGHPIQHRAEEAYRAGFHFHQSEVSRDPALLEWVLRKDYWDYALPGGESILPDHRTSMDTAIQRTHAT